MKEPPGFTDSLGAEIPTAPIEPPPAPVPPIQPATPQGIEQPLP